MKNVLKLAIALAALFVMGSAAPAYSQKFGFLNSEELIMSMPGTDSVSTKLKAIENEYLEMLEAIQVERNKKFNEFQQNMSTLSDGVRQLREKEIQDLSTRLMELQQTAQQDMQRQEASLMAPIVERARKAIEKVSKANGVIAVFDLMSGAMLYHDASVMMDMLPMVKKELGM